LSIVGLCQFWWDSGLFFKICRWRSKTFDLLHNSWHASLATHQLSVNIFVAAWEPGSGAHQLDTVWNHAQTQLFSLEKWDGGDKKMIYSVADISTWVIVWQGDSVMEIYWNGVWVKLHLTMGRQIFRCVQVSIQIKSIKFNIYWANNFSAIILHPVFNLFCGQSLLSRREGYLL